MNSVSHGQEEILQQFLDLLDEMNIECCVIGGLAVNAYVERLVSLDVDVVVAAQATESLLKSAAEMFRIEKFAYRANLASRKSDLRIQLQTESAVPGVYCSFFNKRRPGL